MTNTTTARGRAVTRNAKVVLNAGAPGHILTTAPQPTRWRTDLVDPELQFVVYGIPAPQGSKRYAGTVNGKPVLKEQVAGLEPWRAAVRAMAQTATGDHTVRTGVRWQALQDPVLVGIVVTVPATAAATKRGDVYVSGPPDLDKLQRAIGDALAPVPVPARQLSTIPEAQRPAARKALIDQQRATCVLRDDSLIGAWQAQKVYPNTIPTSLGHPGVLIQVWDINRLRGAEACPGVPDEHGRLCMTPADVRAWARPMRKDETWEAAVARLTKPGVALWGDAPSYVEMSGERGITDLGILTVLRAGATTPDARLPLVRVPT